MYTKLETYIKYLSIASMLCFTANVLAVDGVIEINQARVLAGGVTLGDAPGFPVTLSQSSSYRLTGNLTLPNENTSGIEITANDISLDLNGFGIFGIVVCSLNSATVVAVECLPSGGTGVGVQTQTQSISNISIVNGTVRGMGAEGFDIDINKGVSRIQSIRAISNGSDGIRGFGTVSGNTAILNGGVGIAVIGTTSGNTAIFNGGDGIAAGGTVNGNTSDSNIGDGISANGTVSGNATSNNFGDGISASGTVSGNTSANNGGRGISISGSSLVSGNLVTANKKLGLSGTDSVYGNNVFTDNNGGNGNPQVGFAREIGSNFCGTNTTCP